MTMLSVRSASVRFRFRMPVLKAAWRWLPRRAGRALLRAMRESRARAAVKVFHEYAHLIADDESAAEKRSVPPPQ